MVFFVFIKLLTNTNMYTFFKKISSLFLFIELTKITD